MKAKIRILQFSFIFLCIWGSCKNKQPNAITSEEIASDPLAYIQDINADSELKNEKAIGSINYSITQVPSDMEALKRINPKLWSQDSLNSYIKNFRKDYSQIAFINYKITVDDLNSNVLSECQSNFSSYQDLVYYCSFHISKDIFLIVDNDTLPCHSLGFEQTYEIGKELNFSICFKTKNREADNSLLKNATVIIEDKLFRNGTLKFKFI